MYTRRHTLYLENVLWTNVCTANTWVHLFEKNIFFFECSKLFPCFLGFFLPIDLSSLIQILHHTWWVKFLQYEHINLLALECAGFYGCHKRKQKFGYGYDWENCFSSLVLGLFWFGLHQKPVASRFSCFMWWILLMGLIFS